MRLGYEVIKTEQNDVHSIIMSGESKLINHCVQNNPTFRRWTEQSQMINKIQMSVVNNRARDKGCKANALSWTWED